ncbi:nuclease-related domain-containing protein [Arthrobacter pigmenti]
MTAGDRASEQSRRAAERVERLRKELAQAERTQQAWSRGAEGEAQVALRLKALESFGWVALHDTHWPGRPKANIDHVLIGPGGVVVIDSKNWSGEVQVRDGVLRQNGYRRERETGGVLGQCAALAAIVDPQFRQCVRGALCLLQQPHMRTSTSDGMAVLGVDHLVDSIASLPVILSPEAVKRLVDQLGPALQGRTSPRLMTTAETNRWDSHRLQPRQGPGRFPPALAGYPNSRTGLSPAGGSRRRYSARNRQRPKRTQVQFVRTVVSIGAIFIFANLLMSWTSSLG